MEILIEKPEKIILSEPVLQTEYEFEEEKQIIVHCHCDSRGRENDGIRIWRTTYLEDKETA
jgi:hypothetical protein